MTTTHVGYAGLTLGLSASLAANVAHAIEHSGTSPVPLAGAAFWPLALFLMSELLFRTRMNRASDYAVALAVAAVAAGAGWISFGHTRSLLTSWGETSASATLGALAVDGVLIASGLVLYREALAAQAARETATQPARPAQAAHPARPAQEQPVQAPQTQAHTPPEPPPPAQEAQDTPAHPEQRLHVVPAHTDEVHALKARGMSVRAIAAHLEISPSTVQRRLKAS